MAADREVTAPMNFHCQDRPEGMKDYIVRDLTDVQKTCLKERKTETVRENQKYLKAHPEVRAIVALILRMFMKQKPRGNFYEAIVTNFFLEPRPLDLRAEIAEYLAERKEVWGVNSAEILADQMAHAKVPTKSASEHHREAQKQLDKKRKEDAEILESSYMHVTIDEKDLIWKSVREALFGILDRIESIAQGKADAAAAEQADYLASLEDDAYAHDEDDDLVDVISIASVASIDSVLKDEELLDTVSRSFSTDSRGSGFH